MEDRFKNRTQFYISVRSEEKRAKVLDFLESEGFSYKGSWNRETVLESFLPILIEMDDKTISDMGNVTCAACAASAKLIMTAEQFYELYAELQSAH